ncbi:L-seryl-tRNA(Sec) selenium transferase [Pantoea sp. Acro-805]|uniref:L-seryl-tRNA(Sec) selenium transferase n=1 Tax=Candidatus Pantoea formicae TaxID=2608355 RepID=A0ABX0QZ44_9GAMM|nr:L-seryl-tRNA(Sec) selenium transferase [Pantoea formicae]MDF7649253.1 L-seryl-tRNA(Sec) selenium transferase [Erwiniaceae bacterium L1_54_3]NIF02254.1 L-seryl-tRNA(Sec) selenium transferase [Pantoea formicae]
MKTLFTQLPAIDSLLRDPALQPLLMQSGTALTTRQLRDMQQEARTHIQQHQSLPSWHTDWPQEAQRRIEQQQQSALRPVFNLTGTVLHTNLGRAPLSERAIEAVTACLRQPVTLEYALNDATRGHRDRAVSELLCELTGAEAACVVNNNAAAVLLMLAALAPGREVIVSRGELVEIGGAFRIPDVMRQAGCQLVEVGTTNRTHLKDYRTAISDNTGLLMKVHTSNYQIQGFTHAVSEAELVALAAEHQLPVITDLGSGSLIDMTAFNLPAEPMPQQLIASGVDLVSFSGDKLLGGPQAGIIVGKQALIDRLQQHPLKRALRVDKMTLAALEATLQLYRQPETLREALPALRLLTRPAHDILQQAERLLPALEHTYGAEYSLAIAACSSQIGSGSLPVERLPSFALTFSPKSGHGSALTALAQRWRALPRPVIGRLQDSKLWLDLRCLEDEAALIRTLTA